MKEITFRPFRKVGDKLIVTNYSGWRKLYSANNEGAIVKLLPFPEVIKGETIYSVGNPNGKYNYWHPTKFEALFWAVNAKIRFSKTADSLELLRAGLPHPYSEPMQEDEVHSMFDCDGCPVFSQITMVYVSENYKDKMHLFDLLTANIVYEYFEKIRDELNNLKWVH